MATLIPDHQPRGLLERRRQEYLYRGERYAPEPDLAALIEVFWTVSWRLESPRSVRTLPDPSAHLVVEAGASSVVGLVRGCFERHLEGEGRIVAAKFHPGGLRPFLAGSAEALTDRKLPLQQLLPLDVATLEAAVLSEAPELDRVQLLEEALRALMPPVPEAVSQVRAALAAIRADPELQRVDVLALELGCSVRTLQRLFREYVGASPKWVIRRIRLQEALARLVGPPRDQAELALELGYADQAHFIRDFSRTVGQTPGAYARRYGA